MISAGETAIEIRGFTVPKLGFGTWRLSGQEARERVATALGLGYRHIDTAAMYDNESDVGAGIADAKVDRASLWLTTKVWYEDLEPRSLAASVDASMKALKVDYLDLLLVHWPNPNIPFERTYAAMLKLIEHGRTRAIGVSNFPSALVEEAQLIAKDGLVCNQVEYHPLLSQRAVIAACRAHDMFLTAYSPLAKGEVARDETLTEIGKTYGKSASQVGLRWLIQQPNVCAIPKAGSRAHAQANLDIFDFTLSPADVRRIDGMACGKRTVNVGFAPRWDAE